MGVYYNIGTSTPETPKHHLPLAAFGTTKQIKARAWHMRGTSLSSREEMKIRKWSQPSLGASIVLTYYRHKSDLFSQCRAFFGTGGRNRAPSKIPRQRSFPQTAQLFHQCSTDCQWPKVQCDLVHCGQFDFLTTDAILLVRVFFLVIFAWSSPLAVVQ